MRFRKMQKVYARVCVCVCVCLGRKKGAIEGCSIVYVVSQWALLNV